MKEVDIVFERDFQSKYFPDSTEYPQGDVADNPLPVGLLYEYISSTFLDAFINYVDIKKAYLLNRYNKWDGELGSCQIREPAGTYNWIKFSGTKEEIFDKLTEKGRIIHSKLSELHDDVMILAKSKRYYYFFWYDCDVSDCSIGRFETDDSEEEVIEEFTKYCTSPNAAWAEGSKEIPLHYFSGWIGR